ncbi:FlgO family outer membrane protein [Leptospira brenneri]|uniref:FlgO family outer membrane protein n=1 Tax=Leptospira brenneri TaxID=2023182 RepID=UPI000C2A09B6|nr:FlgO family outer membrane protein [Leptospira brenneri]PJZ43647.1 curli production assembly/transport component CsgG domain protein [Leptospira brenneri]
MSKLKILAISILIAACSSVPEEKPVNPNLDDLDKVAKELKEQLVLNYKFIDKKPLAIASFVRNDLSKPSAKYASAIPKLGIYLANSLQNEMFLPDNFELIERQRIDGILEEINYGKLGLNEQAALDTIKLTGAELLLLGTIQKRESSMRFDARIVSISDGKILSVGTSVIALSSYLNRLYGDYPEKQQDYSETIYANGGWQVVNTFLESGSTYVIEYSGEWSMTNNRRSINYQGSDSNPSSWGDYRLYSNFNHGQLLCRLKDNPNLIISPGKYNIKQGSFMECRINDTDLGNNEGYMIVKIKYQND